MTHLFLIYKLDLHSTTCNANANIPCASVTARTGHHFLMLLDPPSSPLHHWASPPPLSDSMGLAFAPVVKQDWRPSNLNRINTLPNEIDLVLKVKPTKPLLHD